MQEAHPMGMEIGTMFIQVFCRAELSLEGEPMTERLDRKMKAA